MVLFCSVPMHIWLWKKWTPFCPVYSAQDWGWIIHDEYTVLPNYTFAPQTNIYGILYFLLLYKHSTFLRSHWCLLNNGSMHVKIQIFYKLQWNGYSKYRFKETYLIQFTSEKIKKIWKTYILTTNYTFLVLLW